jgi:hypothetical protein
MTKAQRRARFVDEIMLDLAKLAAAAMPIASGLALDLNAHEMKRCAEVARHQIEKLVDERRVRRR